MTLEWTGERFLPSINGAIELEHMHRYIIAREFVQNKRILDIACGEGYGSNFLADNAGYVFGVDIDSQTIDHAKNKYIKPNLEFKVGSCSNIPLPNHCIDVVVSFETIEHHAEHEKMMSEILRVLRPEGLLIISSPDKHQYSDVTSYNNPFHVKELYKDELEALLSSHFTHHLLLGQRVLYGSNITHLQKDIAEEYFAYSGDTQNISKNNGINRPLYFIAIASKSDLPKICNSFFEGAHRDLLEKDNFITQLTISLQDKEQQLFHQSSMVLSQAATIASLNCDIVKLYASNSWRICAPLRSLSHVLKKTMLILSNLVATRIPKQIETHINKVHLSDINKNKIIPVSILIPSFNHARFIGQAIESVLAQDFTDYELLIGDDCSTDHSKEIIERYKDTRIKTFFFAENIGNTHTLEFLIKEAKGKYIAVLDSDDFWHSSKLSKQYTYMENHPGTAACFTWADFITENGQKISIADSPHAELFYQENRTQGEWLSRFFYLGNCLAHPSILMKKNIYEISGSYNQALRQLNDFELWVRIVKKFPIKVICESLICHRQLNNDNNISAPTEVNVNRHHNELFYVYSNFFEEMSDDIFVDGFKSKFIKSGTLTHDELLCEQAFILLEHTPSVGFGLNKLNILLNNEQTRKVLLSSYHFTDKDYFNITGAVKAKNM